MPENLDFLNLFFFYKIAIDKWHNISGGYNERGKTSREKAQQINISKAMGDTMGYCHGFIYRNCQPYGVFEHRAAALFRSARLFGRERMAKKDL